MNDPPSARLGSAGVLRKRRLALATMPSEPPSEVVSKAIVLCWLLISVVTRHAPLPSEPSPLTGNSTPAGFELPGVRFSATNGLPPRRTGGGGGGESGASKSSKSAAV